MLRPAMPPRRAIHRGTTESPLNPAGISLPGCPAAAASRPSTVRFTRRVPGLTRKFAAQGLLALVLPAALIVTAVIPLAAPPESKDRPVVTGYAIFGAASAFTGDLATMDEAAALELEQDSLSFGQPVPAPVSAPARVGQTTQNNVNLRKGPGTAYAVVAKLPKATVLEVIGERAGWYRVATAKGTVGWISDDYLVLRQGTGSAASAPPARAETAAPISATVAESRVNLRKGPDTRFGSYGKLAAGTSVTVLARYSSWYQVRSARGTIGWIAQDLIEISRAAAARVPVATSVPSLPAPSVSSGAAPAAKTSGERVVAPGNSAGRIALRYVGAPYRWGGASPRGFDCSGLTQYVYRQLGVDLPHKASLQFSTRYGQRIRAMGSLAPGDLVFFVRTTPARGITHVGIYVGNGMMVTANSARVGVQYVNINGKYWRTRYAGGLRPYR